MAAASSRSNPQRAIPRWSISMRWRRTCSPVRRPTSPEEAVGSPMRRYVSAERILKIATAALLLFLGAAAHAENLDAGKSGARLFADSCATCHRSARGLAKGRFRLTLYLFLEDHYVTNSGAAWALTSYLESVDSPKSGRSRAAATNRPRPATGTPGSAHRPPMPVP